ncbi:MAG: hypothetical protein MUF07_06100 [Steroidobacteraceae bacterium]|jgi:hypothetical protein|nr:hypothetical protein [Steroidobacteraceae bacterium]
MGRNYYTHAPDAVEPTEVAIPRRRLGRVEHDERGNARMEWALLPEGHASERQVLTILDEPGAGESTTPLSLARDPKRGFSPYGDARGGAFGPPAETPSRRKPKDLRKLGEWLKLTRELEERRKRGED